VTQTAGTEVTGDNEFQTLHEIVHAAHANLDQSLWDYVIGGTETETTVRRNRQALDRIAFRPRVLRDVSSIDPASVFMGHRVRLPVILAPVGGLEAIGEGGGITVAQGAGLAGIPFFLSSVTLLGMEAVAAAASGPKVFQLYVRGDGAWVDDHVRRAADCGFDAFCLTVDSAIYSRRERDIVNRFSKPWRGPTPGMSFQAALSWDEVRRFRDKHDIRLILKGIGTPEDAEIACQHGVDVVYVSNHGGRQLDHSLGSMDILPEIVAAVAGRASVMIDGGFSRGTDIVKAIALGASAVGIGRLYCYGLAAAGAAGIARVIELLEVEVATCLGLLGLTSFAEIDASYVRIAEPITESGVHGAFPLLRLPASA
jgi:isopentenyl diphosphate isomerase/L-lactate dehydrogenase-like FMN-dependent dehydrogenase